MKNQVENVVYKNSTMKFGFGNIIHSNSPEYITVTDTINRMVALQDALGKKVAQERLNGRAG
jgi:hypothetical protein